jgi:hypothetical protein
MIMCGFVPSHNLNVFLRDFINKEGSEFIVEEFSINVNPDSLRSIPTPSKASPLEAALLKD